MDKALEKCEIVLYADDTFIFFTDKTDILLKKKINK